MFNMLNMFNIRFKIIYLLVSEVNLNININIKKSILILVMDPT